jgi:pilus assembly protein CpaF
LRVFSIVITEKGGAQRQLDFEGPEIGIGRLEDNDICLPKNNVSKHHARLSYKDDRFLLVDQKSTNGTYVNGRRIAAPIVVKRGDKIYIGDFILTLLAPEGMGEPRVSRAPMPYVEGGGRMSAAPRPRRDSEESRTRSFVPSAPLVPSTKVVAVTDAPQHLAPATIAAPEPVSEPLSEPLSERALPKPASLRPPPVPRDVTQAMTVPPSAPPPAPHSSVPAPEAARARPHSRSIPPWSAHEAGGAQSGLTSPAVLAPSVRLQGALAMLMERLATQLDIHKPAEAAFPSQHAPLLERAMDELASEGAIAADLDRRFLRDSAISEAVGLGPLDRLLANRAVREVVIDGPARILADLGGGLSPVSSFFSGADAVLVVARRLMHRAGRELDTALSVQEGQLPGGGLVQILLPPLSPKGPLISVRCPPRDQSSAESMITDGLLSSDMLGLLRAAVAKRQNVLVIGPRGSGVSTLLAALSTLAPDHERVAIIEDHPSTSLLRGQTLPLSRSAVPQLDLDALIALASRLRCDRLVIDDLRAADALAALTSAAAGNGVLLGMHAADPGAGLTQLEMFAQLALGAAGGGTSAAAANAVQGSLVDLVARAVQVVVHLAPGKDGARRVQSISELKSAQHKGKGSDTLELRALFRHENGVFKATDHRASFL